MRKKVFLIFFVLLVCCTPYACGFLTWDDYNSFDWGLEETETGFIKTQYIDLPGDYTRVQDVVMDKEKNIVEVKVLGPIRDMDALFVFRVWARSQ